ncbi:hypothetical protein [Neorhizobium sp. P12A]|uniref:hypothetical protein n=1 Tax=Neorhizobium sp. P12A TaxID=2268027 RepID=UPI0011EFE303|nr:hypothetical protein [Neorhizobium sp. P12A]
MSHAAEKLLGFPEGDAVADVVALVSENPGSVLTDDNLYDRFVAQLRKDVAAFVPDLSTATSRKKITSEAFRITRFKTAIDDAGKKLNEDRRKEINAVDAKRRTVKADLEELAEDARRPLTQWEVQEEARVASCLAIIKHIEDCGNGLIGGEPQAFGLLFYELEQKIVINSDLGEFEDQARTAHRIATEKLTAAFEAHKKAEADRIELEKLRAEKAERDRIERERAEQRLNEELKAKQAAEQKAHEERVAQAAREQAEREAKAAVEKAEREAAAAIAKAEAEVSAVKEAAERAEQRRQDEIRREQEEREHRERDREHRGKIMSAAKEALMAQGIDEEPAKKIVLAIIAGEIPNVRLEF